MKRAMFWGTMAAVALFYAPKAGADAVHGPVLIVTDTPTEFRAIGSLTTVDDDNPVNGAGGKLLKVESANNANWSFEIGHLTGAPHYQNVNGAWHLKSVGVLLQGARANNVGHIATPHAGEAANGLPAVTTAPRKRDDLEIGKRGRSRSTGGLVGHGQHFDYYHLESEVAGRAGNPNAAPAPPGPPNILTGAVEIVAQHRAAAGAGGSSSEEGSFYSDPNGGTSVSFDARSGELRFRIGRINGLDFSGGRLHGVESRFMKDPMLDATWTVTPIRLKGLSEGGFEFGGGEVEVNDAEGRFSILAGFDRFRIEDSTSYPLLKSYGVLTRWEIEREPLERCASPFLERFVRRNFLGDGMSAEQWRRWRGIDVAVVTQRSLAEATQGFTVSADRVPATVYLTLNLAPEGEEEPPVQQQAAPAEAKATPKPEKKKDDLAGQVTDWLEKTFPKLKEDGQ